MTIMTVLICLSVQPAGAAPLTPTRHGDFSYYTFALTWQPGFCSTDAGCLADQPRTPLIGLHGLWASLPQTLSAQGVVAQQWWQQGCDYFAHSDAAPQLEPTLERGLAEVMPHLAQSLLTHEFDKHVQCFGFDPNQFFSTELAMRQAVADGAFGRYLLEHAGQTVSHADIATAFGSAFATPALASLQLECGHDATGQPILTQLWLTIAANRLASFPNADALIDAPIAQDDCPATFFLPPWPASS
jgi:ribonuclease I